MVISLVITFIWWKEQLREDLFMSTPFGTGTMNMWSNYKPSPILFSFSHCFTLPSTWQESVGYQFKKISLVWPGQGSNPWPIDPEDRFLPLRYLVIISIDILSWTWSVIYFNYVVYFCSNLRLLWLCQLLQCSTQWQFLSLLLNEMMSEE